MGKKKDKKAAGAAAKKKKDQAAAGEGAPAEAEAADLPATSGHNRKFFQRTGHDAAKRNEGDMTINIENIELFAGGTPLLGMAHLRVSSLLIPLMPSLQCCY